MAQSTPYTVPSLAGGVSEQAHQDRHPTMCQEQDNCNNDPNSGVRPRAGGVVLGTVSGYAMTSPYCYTFSRDEDELYQVLVEGGELRVFNMNEGVECTVTDNTPGGHLETYLTHTDEAFKAFDAVTVEDTTFLANRQVVVRMDTATTDERPNEAIFYFKAGSYSTTYRARIKRSGTWYQAAYTTPDNSDPGNARFISTTRLAIELRDVLDTLKADVAPALNSFTFTRIGSAIIVSSSSSTTFEVDSQDGAGDTQLYAMTEWADSFSDLPSRAPFNYQVGVRGERSERKDDYWIRYKGAGSTTGYWEEIPKPGIKYRVDEATMPLVITSTAKNVFEVDVGSWGERLAGDGVRTSKNPQFINRKIRSLGFSSGRFQILTSGGMDMSRARNGYAFFPDTAQTRLATDPISFQAGTGSTSFLHHLVSAPESITMWGDRSQIKVEFGDGGVSEDNLDNPQVSQYEYDGVIKPCPIGSGSVVFTTAKSSGNSFTEVLLDKGYPSGELMINEQCAKYVSGTIKAVSGGLVAGMLTATILESPIAYLYQWRNVGNERRQSAWNRWTFSGVDKVVALAQRGGDLYGMFKIGSVLVFERFHMDPSDKAYQWVRLDHRLTEVGATWSGNVATLDLPFSVAADDRASWVAIENEEPTNGRYLGRQLELEWVDGNTVRVTAYETLTKFWIGAKITARRKFSRLSVQTQTGTILPNRLLIEKVTLSLEDSTYTKFLVEDNRGNTLSTQEWDARLAFPGTPVTELALASEEVDFKVGQENKKVWITLINDTPYPSKWVMVDWHYGLTKR